MDWASFFTPQQLTPWGALLVLMILAITGKLSKPWTARIEKECDDRIADLKESHAEILKAKDAEIAHLRATAVSLADSVAIQSKVQEQQLQTSEIVKSVMAGLQKASYTGPQQKVTGQQ
jgi:hypothetical protein